MIRKNSDYCPLIEALLVKALNNNSVAVTAKAEYQEEPEKLFNISVNASFKAKDLQEDYERPGSTADIFATHFAKTCRNCTLPIGDRWRFTLSFDVKEDTSIKAPRKVRLEYTRKTDSWNIAEIND